MNNRKVLNCASVFALALGLSFTTTTFADVIADPCNLHGKIALTSSTQIVCEGDLNIADDTVIETNGQDLLILAVGVLNMASSNGGGLQIVSSAKNTGLVEISASTASGYLKIKDAGEVAIEYITTNNYDQSIVVGEYANVSVKLNNYYVTAANDTFGMGEIIQN